MNNNKGPNLEKPPPKNLCLIFLVPISGFPFCFNEDRRQFSGKRHDADICWCIQDVASHKFFGVSFDKPRWWSLQDFSCTVPSMDVMFFRHALFRSTQTIPNEHSHTHSHSHTHTHTRLSHTHKFTAFLDATHLKTQLAQIIKINTLEAWHYAKRKNSHFERNLIKNYWIISVYSTCSLSSLLLIYYMLMKVTPVS